MLSKLSSLFSDEVKGQLEDKLEKTVGIDADKADDVVKVGTESIFDGFKDELLSGNVSGLTNLVKGNVQDVAENAIIKKISGKVVGAICSKVGLPEAVSQKAVDTMIPVVMNLMNKKDEDESAFSLGGMFDMISGNKKEEESGDLLGSITKGFGGLFG